MSENSVSNTYHPHLLNQYHYDMLEIRTIHAGTSTRDMNSNEVLHRWYIRLICHVIISTVHYMHLLCIPIFYTTNHKSHSLSPPRLKTRLYHMREHKRTSYNSTSTCTVIIPHTHRTIALYVRSTIPSNMPPVAIGVDVDVGRDSRD